MQLWPAIDIREGRCVRLVQGDFDRETSYGDPLSVAEEYVRFGAERLHVVDLDAARTGFGANRDVIGAITRRLDVPVQVGGGVRDDASAEALLALGVERLVLGTAAVTEPSLLERLAARWPERILAGLDYRRNAAGVPEVAVRGWTQASGYPLAEVLGRLRGAELAGVVVTDIARDGTGEGPDLPGLGLVLGWTRLSVVASGGVASAGDLERLGALAVDGRRLEGAIVGRALLSGRLSLADALLACGTGGRPE
ncbi:MAG TPA: 1-(5-phosphoribosyl)-5-[(5-phosphoribosylamino)methylideneamino] imidazole-4-carboxamide isomerase [Acidimicrobiales bacterium]|nr:1-(5-phosphoribosyl)-5-[(5-phosphoribosylamino)methylideneamino] imidazole-4-carboxamide isomerase [Acidimicrobiales bacterium]